MFYLARKEGLLQIYEDYQNIKDENFQKCLYEVALNPDPEKMFATLEKFYQTEYHNYYIGFLAIFLYCNEETLHFSQARTLCLNQSKYESLSNCRKYLL
jgi:hypothetical protein